MEFLRDPFWQFIGVVLTIITIFIPFIILRKERSKKELSSTLILARKILSSQDQEKGDLQILYKDLAVKNCHIIVIKLINSGNAPITSADFEKPLEIVFLPEGNILNAEIIDSNPLNLDVSSQINGNIYQVFPLLLNKGDFITIKFIVTPTKEYVFNSRIIGIQNIKEIQNRRVNNLVRIIFGLALISLGLFVALIFISTTLYKIPKEVSREIIIPVLIGLFVYMLGSVVIIGVSIIEAKKSARELIKLIKGFLSTANN